MPRDRPGIQGGWGAAILGAAALAATVALVPAAAASGGAGRLEGSVAVGPQLSARKIRFNLYSDPAQPAPAAQPRDSAAELANVIIYFEPAKGLEGASAPRPAHPVMRQEGLTFVPHVLAIPRGSTIEFPNGDSIFHNVFSLSKAASFDLGRYPKGSSKSIRFDTPGIIKVFCHIHSDMSGVIVVLDNPFFAVPDRNGRYAIDGIPPGEYRVMAWHERARPLERSIRIEPGRATVADFSIPLTESAGGD
jgi:plastocyanin